VVGGLLASGKSTLAEALARAIQAVHLSADAVRAELHDLGHADAFVPGFSRVLYPELLARAGSALAVGRTVVVDGTFRSRALRARARALAAAHGVPFLFVECRVPVSVARERLCRRERAEASRGWLAMLDAFLARWEPVDELAPSEYAPVDATGPVDACVRAVTSRLGLPAPPP
jgi:predicted kinase